jgi:hypothetical protein
MRTCSGASRGEISPLEGRLADRPMRLSIALSVINKVPLVVLRPGAHSEEVMIS